MKKGLVLAGGGARGSYQVGVYAALRQLGWMPDVIAGTSVGCLNGAMFALDLLQSAVELWQTMSGRDVMILPEDADPERLHTYFLELVRGGGLDMTPLQESIDAIIDEDDLRACPVRFGLVTVEMATLTPHELSIDEIPYGRLRDYMMASSACFPAFKPRVIDGVKYIDGGYNDNIPYALAARMGAEELVAVNVYGIGVNRPNRTGLPTVTVESRWDLGGILEFDPARARRNMALGKLDCLRAFGRLRGGWYGLTQDQPEWAACFAGTFEALLARAARRNALTSSARSRLSELFSLPQRRESVPENGDAGTGGLWPPVPTVNSALLLFGSPDRELAPLELAARECDVDPCAVYAPEALGRAFAERYRPDEQENFALLWEEDADVGRTAQLLLQATLNPHKFICALCAQALKEMPLP